MHIGQERKRDWLHHCALTRARTLLDGIIAYRDELGELGQDLERMLRAAGIKPSRRSAAAQFTHLPPAEHDRH
jgi:hypothetical protein